MKVVLLSIGLANCLVLFTSTTVAIKPKPRTICPTYFISLDGHCYYFGQYPVRNRDRAQKQCEQMNQRAILINLESVREWQTIKDYLQDNGLSTYDWWTGGTNRVSVNEWIWTGTNEPIYFTFWCPGEPNYPDRKNCIFLRNWPPRSGNLCWKNVECNNRDFDTYYICEVEPI